MNKISCEDARLLLSLYIDNVLSDEEMTQVREHLDECDSCRSEHALLKGIMKMSAKLPEIEVSSAFAARLHDKLSEEAELIMQEKEEEKYISRMKKWRIYPMVAAGAAAVIAISVFAFGNLPDSEWFVRNSETKSVATASPTAESLKQEASEADVIAEVTAEPEPEKQKNEESKPVEKNTKKEEIKTEKRKTVAKETTDKEEAQPEQDLSVNNVAEAEVESGTETAEESVPMAVSITTEEIAAQNATEESMQKSLSGGGGSARRSSYSEIIKTTMIFRFETKYGSVARETMSGAMKRGSVYIVPVAKLAEYTESLKTVEGYVAHSRTLEDFTDEYRSLIESGGNEDRIAELESYVNYATVIIEN